MNGNGGDILRRLSEDVFRIEVPIQHELKNFNLYLFTGEHPALIDAGPFHPLLEEVVAEALRRAGVAELEFIYLTHSHIDHFGMAARLRARTGGAVAAHRFERPRIERAGARLEEEYRCYASLSERMGFPREVAEAIFSLAHVWTGLSQPCPVDVPLRGGERVKAGDRELEAVHTPGHTAGHLCYYERSEGLLFSGDHLMRSITPNPELYCPPWRGEMTGLPQFLESLELLRGYDIAVAYPGHGGPINKASRRIDMNLLHHQRRLEKTLEAVKRGCVTVWETALRLFPQVRGKPPQVDHFLALKEALGHLLILEKEGLVRCDRGGEVWRFTSS
ncbi:MAG: MBL fold metallo-hydrolase [Actinomycetota bacterium]|nr:MBL fold metallo-hydrolase [Actinomycetota bacterium]